MTTKEGRSLDPGNATLLWIMSDALLYYHLYCCGGERVGAGEGKARSAPVGCCGDVAAGVVDSAATGGSSRRDPSSIGTSSISAAALDAAVEGFVID